MNLKLPVAIRNEELDWTQESTHAKRLDEDQCKEQATMWLERLNRMKNKGIEIMTYSSSNGSYRLYITQEEVSRITGRWCMMDS